jgi:hypothetical protein
VNLSGIPHGGPGPFVGKVPEQMGGGDPVTLPGDKSQPLTDPGILDELTRLPPVTAMERAHLDS